MLPDPNDRPQSRRRRGLRGLTVGIALSALAVFIGLIGYTYMYGAADRADGPVPLIKAESRPIKTAPDKPGGMDVPHQDKEIYNRMGRDSEASSTSPRVERLLPPPEAPIERPRPANAPPPLEPEIPPPPVVTPPPGAVEVAKPPDPAPTPAPAPARPVVSAPAPQSPPAAIAAPPPQSASPRPSSSPAPAAATAGRYRIQLAALRSSDDANREWERLRRAHPDLLGPLTLKVVRADLAGRGTFYRIQAGPIGDDSAAKELCRRLAAKKVGCLVVRP